MKDLEEVFGKHYGSELDFDSQDILAIQHIDGKTLAKEASLFDVKWFDYRQLHPTAATYLFVHYYNRAYGTFMATTLDYKKRYMAAFKGKDFTVSREKRSFWRLRQKVDELGIRYEFFLREAMNWCIERGWRQPPRPAHLIEEPELTIYVLDKWEMECRAKIQFAKSGRFTVSNFVNGRDQRAYEGFLIDQIMKRPNPKYAIHTALYVHDAIRIETAIEKLPSQALIDAVSDFQ